jgi:DNA polymerase III subunit epsilon
MLLKILNDRRKKMNNKENNELLENEDADLEIEDENEDEENEITFDTNDDIKKILFFDTETSDFIKKDWPANHENQAWTVQIGALLTDTNGNELDRLNVIIKANGRSMNHYAEEVHGISVERTEEEGIDELEAAEKFGLLLHQADMVVGHNLDFDWQYAKHLLERNIDSLSDKARSAFYLDLPNQCTMKDKAVVKFCGLKNKLGKPKWPKLVELYDILFKSSFDAHDAFEDIVATSKCYFEMLKQGIIENKLQNE